MQGRAIIGIVRCGPSLTARRRRPGRSALSAGVDDFGLAPSLPRGARTRGVLHLLSGSTFRVARSGGGIGLMARRVFGGAGTCRRLRRVLHLLTRRVARSARRFCRLRKRRGRRENSGRCDDECLHACLLWSMEAGTSASASRPLRFTTGITWQSAAGSMTG